ncbi:hypothetical protein A1Q2_01428 [Trichosporon asahii var. asahii CBS 8904]|uniref:Uncharacterized protein n=1 Tax=Trichosporon asahii var. asahii (strain CBS 8904) TaxID=1220162 RepID=K1VJI1_TRIAC|nr:hypothetical protein A1Q2_01428 [Trichosporon asahii var. asahii CBS 8904]
MLRTLGTRLPRRLPTLQSAAFRPLSVSAPRFDLKKPEDIEELIAPRERVEKLRKEMEAKYGDKLKNKQPRPAEAEGPGAERPGQAQGEEVRRGGG